VNDMTWLCSVDRWGCLQKVADAQLLLLLALRYMTCAIQVSISFPLLKWCTGGNCGYHSCAKNCTTGFHLVSDFYATLIFLTLALECKSVTWRFI